jgi:hypothetical protein
MAWTSLKTPWRSLVAGHVLADPLPPFNFVTPAADWDYGAISDPLPSEAQAVALTVRAQAGRIGVALSTPNGSRLLSEEIAVAPDQGEVEMVFALDAAEPAVVLVRNYGEGGARGAVLRAEAGSREAAALRQGAARAGAARVVTDDGLPTSPSNVARADEPMWPVSLGNTCEAKVQIARVMQFQRWPATSQAAFRLQMLPPRRSAEVFGWDLFDWQGTPMNALLAYLENDFQGFYERADLEARGGGVQHKVWGTEHLHDYEALTSKAEPAITEAMVDASYAASRARYDQLAEQFRHHLLQPGPFLYVFTCEDIPNETVVRKLIRALAARSPEHRFHLLLVGFEDADADLSALSDQVSKAYRPRPTRDPNLPPWAGGAWEGDYAAWEKALAPFDLRLPNEGLEPR